MTRSHSQDHPSVAVLNAPESRSSSVSAQCACVDPLCKGHLGRFSCKRTSAHTLKIGRLEVPLCDKCMPADPAYLRAHFEEWYPNETGRRPNLRNREFEARTNPHAEVKLKMVEPIKAHAHAIPLESIELYGIKISRQMLEEAAAHLKPKNVKQYGTEIAGKLFPVKQIVAAVVMIPADVHYTTANARRVLEHLGFPIVEKKES